MRIKIFISTAILFLFILQVSGQIYQADNGLTVTGTGTNTKVTLGSSTPMYNSQTLFDFGTNTNTSVLFKKGSNDYFFIGNGGDIGIGHSAPAARLDLNGNLVLRKDGSNYTGNTITMYNPINGVNAYLNSSNVGFVFSTTTNHPIIFGINDNAVTAWHTNGNLRISSINPQFTDNGNRLQVDGSAWIGGNAGIGTASPTAKLDVVGTFKLVDGTQGTGKVLTSDANGLASWQAATGGASQWTTATSNIYFNTGRVGIGTTNLNDANYKLFVEGAIRSRKVRVDQVAWPDYVFNNHYPLLPLTEVEAFIIKNKHLPDVPTASEVEKDGIDLGDSQSLLLRKIEELTLYIIELNKKSEVQSKKIAELEQQVKNKL